jgi:hypothetical protein
VGAVLDAARRLARMGWPVIPVKPESKEPLTAHGVRDASTDDVRIGQWWRKWPDANLGIATGRPGPQVLDIDDPDAAGDKLAELRRLDPPEVATPRGGHLYFAGTDSGTVNLGYGELRGRGSYVVAPPSIHPSGREYTWLREPNGPLPSAPGDVVPADRTTKGAGVRAPVERVPHGERHDHMMDYAIRQVRGGILDPDAIEHHLRAEFERVCDPKPAPFPHAFRRWAEDALKTRIAEREAAKAAEQDNGDTKPKPKAKRTLPSRPARDAALAELREFVAAAGGVPDVIRIEEVIRFGVKTEDAMHVRLTNGMRVEFERQGDVTTPRVWRNAWTIATSGVCLPDSLTVAELGDVLWACCVIARATAEQRFEVELQAVLGDFLDLTTPLRGTFDEAEPRYALLAAIKDRPKYDPADRSDAWPPALIHDMRTGKRYVRGGELMAYAAHAKLGISARAFAGRMRMIGVERVEVQGHGEQGHRRQVLYELPEEGLDE